MANPSFANLELANSEVAAFDRPVVAEETGGEDTSVALTQRVGADDRAIRIRHTGEEQRQAISQAHADDAGATHDTYARDVAARSRPDEQAREVSGGETVVADHDGIAL